MTAKSQSALRVLTSLLIVISGVTKEMNCLHRCQARIESASEKNKYTQNNTVVKTFQKLSSKEGKLPLPSLEKINN